MYKVIKLFTDLTDEGYEYKVGDTYPREGVKPTKQRIEELSGSDNKQGVPLIEKVEEPEEKPKKKGK